MSNPDQIRADIEMTRDELGRDVDALADKVSPPKIMERQRTRVRQSLGAVKDHVMGVADDVHDNVAQAGSDIGDAAKDLPHKAARKAQGAPIVVGLLAAGVGFLVASLIPTTDAETRLSVGLRERAQPLVDKAVDTAKDAAQEVAAELKGPAQDAVEQVKESAKSSAQTLKDEAQHTAERVKENVSAGGSSSSGGAASTGGASSGSSAGVGGQTPQGSPSGAPGTGGPTDGLG
jgi:gas vesicle protein